MFIRVKKKPNGKRSVQVVESYRRADKVNQKIIRHVGQGITDKEVEELKKIADSIIIETKNNRQPVLPFIKPEDIYSTLKKLPTKDLVNISDLKEEQRVIDGFNEVLGKLYSDLNLDTVIKRTKKNRQWNDILKTLAIARVANPESKKRTSSFLEQDYGIKLPLEKIYRTMDHVFECEDIIKKRIAETTLSLFNDKVDILFFDVTTLYFESFASDGLREFGFSKDCKFKETQVVLALITTTNGLPITYKLFPGNMYEGHTLIEMIEELKKTYRVSDIVLVADRAMFTSGNLELMDSQGIRYIVSARLKTMSNELKEEILGSEYKATVINNELNWFKELSHKGRRLIVSYSTNRAKKDLKDRQRLIERLMRKVKDKKIKISDMIPNYGTKKYIKINNQTAEINESKISDDARWDGLHGIITNSKEENVEVLLSRYRDLWQIEEAFRVNKHDLKMRPVYHWTQNRIRAHISICFLAYTLVKQAIHRIKIQYKPMSFEQIRNELAHAQSSILLDTSTKKRYCITSHVTINQKKIYQVFGLKRSNVPFEII